ncbi:MAG: chemotaxis protein CheX [Chloroflexi bacterium]|nr:chemotaxis protein CheX [Chloroflexota bacterium]
MTADHSGPELLKIWAGLAHPGLSSAVEGLCTLLSQPPAIPEIATGWVKLSDAPKLISAEDDLASVALTMSGGANGSLLLLFKPADALQLVDSAMGDPPGTATEIDEMAISVLGEAGNTMAGQFISQVGDGSGLGLWMSVPTVRLEKAGAVVAQAVECLVGDTETAIASAIFKIGEQQIEGSFVVFASPAITYPPAVAA